MTATTTTPVRAADFIGTLGINTHLDFNAYGYQNLPAVEQAVSYLGIHNLRDSAQTSSDVQLWQQVAQATGAKFDDYIAETSQVGMQSDIGFMSSLAQAGLLNAVEGGNEEDDSYPSSLGNNLTATAQVQQQLYTLGHSLGLPVINMSFGSGWTAANNWQGDYGAVGDLSAWTDFANAHTYPNAGQGTDASIERLNGLAELAASTRPVMTTEIGWDLNAGFSQSDVAKFALDATMDGIKDGDAGMYFYGLFDDGAGAFGLMNQDGTARPAGTAIHNLTTLLADSGSTASTFAPTDLAYTLSGTQAGDNSTLIEKSDGSYWLSLWDEGEAAGASHQVTLQLTTGTAAFTTFDPLSGTAALAQPASGGSVTVSVPDHPVLVEIQPAAPPAPTGGGTGSTGGTVTPPAATGPSDLSLAVPGAQAAVAGTALAIAGVSISDPWAAGNPGSLALNLTVDVGDLHMGGVDYGTGAHISGTVAQLNADLAGLTYESTAAGTGTVTVDVWNQAGTEATASFGVTTANAPPAPPPPAPTPVPSSTAIAIDAGDAYPVVLDSNVTITAAAGNHMLFIGGTHDTAILTGGTEGVQAYQGYNTITTGAGNDTIRYAGTGNRVDAGGGTNRIEDSGSGNTIVMPAAGKGMDNIYGYVLNGDTLDLHASLKAAGWTGTQSTLSQYLHVGSSNGYDAIVSVGAPGKAVAVADLHGAGPVSLSTLVAHAIT